MNCRDYEELIRKATEKGLSTHEDRILQQHLQQCSPCMKFYREWNEYVAQQKNRLGKYTAYTDSTTRRRINPIYRIQFIAGGMLLFAMMVGLFLFSKSGDVPEEEQKTMHHTDASQSNRQEMATNRWE